MNNCVYAFAIKIAGKQLLSKVSDSDKPIMPQVSDIQPIATTALDLFRKEAVDAVRQEFEGVEIVE